MRTLLLLALIPSLASAADAVAKPPNIIVVLADDMGWGDPGCYNPKSKTPTPHIDRLAAAGLRFTDAHTPSSVCTPTRYGLLTGRYCWRTKLTRGVLAGYDPLLIEPGRPTLASMLKAKGYATGCVGKWHLGLGNVKPTDYAKPLDPGPLTVGFDWFYGIPASLDMTPYVFVENTAPVEQPTEKIADSKMRRVGGGGFWRGGPIAPSFKHVDVLPRLTEKAVGFIERCAAAPAKPFFLYLPLNAPHTPWMPTDEFRGKSGADWYGDFVVQTDATLGKVLDALDRLKLTDDTLVIFTSDNGAHWLGTDIEKHGHRANANWRGQKADIWEAGHRVPFVVRWPGKVKPGTVASQTICLTDIFATVAGVVGHDLAETSGEDSFSFRAVLEGSNAATRETVVHHSADGLFAIRKGDWKLVVGLGSGGFTAPKTEQPKAGGPAGQLYNLASDPGETDNLWLKNPDKVKELSNELERLRSAGRSR